MTDERQPARANLPTLAQLDEPGTDVAELASRLADELATLSRDPDAVVEIEDPAPNPRACQHRR